MGGALPFANVAVGLFGAASNSASYAAAAAEERKQGIYNAQISRYNGEVAAQSTQFEMESQQQNLRKEKEVVQRKGKRQINEVAQRGYQERGQAKANLAASGADSPLAEAAIVQNEMRNLIEQQDIQAGADYASSIFEHKATQTGQQGVKTIYNQRTQALFQGQSALGASFAKAAQYDQQSSNALTSGVLSAGISLGGMFTGGVGQVAASSPSSSGGGFGDYSPFGGVAGPIAGSMYPVNGPFAPSLFQGGRY